MVLQIMHEERDTLWHFVMSVVKYHESHYFMYVKVLDMYDSVWSTGSCFSSDITTAP